jgi:hypothetical protein
MAGSIDWQDLAAILIAVAAVAWLARASLRRLTGAGCGSCRGPREGGDADGFVSLEEVRRGASRVGSDTITLPKRVGGGRPGAPPDRSIPTDEAVAPAGQYMS